MKNLVTWKCTEKCESKNAKDTLTSSLYISRYETRTKNLVFLSAFAIAPNMCAKEFGMIPRSSGTVRMPSIVYVFPVPVCPYANIVPGWTPILTESKLDNTYHCILPKLSPQSAELLCYRHQAVCFERQIQYRK